MGIELKPGSIEDATFMADVHTAEYPDSPADPDEYRLDLVDPTQVWSLNLVFSSGHRVGYALAHHNNWSESPDRYAQLHVGLLPVHRDAATFATVLEALEPVPLSDGAEALLINVREGDGVTIGVLEERGYREERRERFWELDLVEAAEGLQSMATESRAQMQRQGITITTLAADPDPERFRKLHVVSSEGEVDVPATATTLPYPFDAFMEWLSAPMIHLDRVWIARSGDDVIGISMLAYPRRGVVTTAWTTVARQHRGRGVARALKVETCLQAIDLGVDRVRTSNDFKNAPILHLNEEFGYRHIYDWIAYQKVFKPAAGS
jgi:GNAT superfamily N-acetyltransferase